MTRQEFVNLKVMELPCQVKRGSSLHIGESFHLKLESEKYLHVMFFCKPSKDKTKGIGSVTVYLDLRCVFSGDDITLEQIKELIN